MAISTLSGEFKNTPKDASLVLCSVNGGLNREETLSDHHIVLTDNLGEENLLPGCWERRDLRVPVIKTPPEVGYTNHCLRRKGCVSNTRPQFLPQQVEGSP
ncbi:MAG: hypothetical protein ACFFCD_09580 [Promethearchaeota archaeon]